MLGETRDHGADASPADGDAAPADAGGTRRRIRYFGDYELLEEIARGGMGVIYKARQVSLDRIVAIKMIRAGRLASDVDVRRFHAEAEAAANLQHPNIVAIHEVGEHEGRHYFSMDYIEGRSLEEMLRENPLPAGRAAGYARAIAEAVEYAHRQGTLHRDLKPSNVLIDRHDQPQITDFGLAKRVRKSDDLTKTGEVMGTPNYMSPEQATAKQADVKETADIYSLGAMLYALLTGRPPFQADTPLAMLKLVAEQEPVPPRMLNRNIPRDLETICLRCLEKERRRRYPTARELADDLQRFLNGEPIHARPVGRAERLWRWCRRKPVVAGLAALVAGAVVVGGVVSSHFAAEAARKREEADRRRHEARRSRYSADMVKARQDWEKGDAGRLWSFLDGHRPKPGEEDLRGWEWYYLQALLHKDLHTFRGHVGTVHAVDWSQDGSRLASAGEDHTLRVWSGVGGKPLGVLRGHSARVTSVAWSPDSRHLASASDDGTVRIWDWEKSEVIATLTGHRGPVNAVAWRADGRQLASAGKDSKVKVWDVATGEESLSLCCGQRTGPLSSVSWSPDGQRLAAGQGGTTTLWDVTTGGHRHVPDRSGLGPVWSVAWRPDGQLLAVANKQLRVQLWNPVTAEMESVLLDHKGPVRSVAWSPDGERLASASDDRTLKIWDVAAEKVAVTLFGHHAPVVSVTWKPDGTQLATASEDGTIKVWDATQVAEAVTTRRHSNWVIAVAWSPDGKRLASAHLESEVGIWDPDTGDELTKLKGHTDRVWCVAWSPDGKRLATGGMDKTVRVWEAVGGPALLVLEGLQRTV